MYKVRALMRLHGESIPDGYQNRGNTFECSRDTAHTLAQKGAVEILEGDDSRENFETKGGEGAPSSSETNGGPSSSSPPGSPPAGSTLPPAAAGQSSRSATDTGSGGTSKRSTQPTTAGGGSTSKKSAGRTAKPTDGAKTAKRAGTLTSDGSNPSTAPGSVSDPALSTGGR
jgi:hypothetical protein